MDLSIVPSRAGPPTCRAGEAYLHSRYDPAAEAARFASEALDGRAATSVIIIGPCLGYLVAGARSALPRATIVSVQLSPAFKGKELFEADFCWYPDSGRPLDSYIYAAIGEDSISGVAVISWPPAESAYPEAARSAASSVRIALDRLASSSATVKAFGRSWIANACRSFLLAESAASFPTTKVPVVVAASGPTLRPSLEELRGYRGDFMLIAVSSSLAACRSAGFEPDLAVSTDGGNWSRYHLYPLLALGRPLAAPLTALPSACLSRETPLFALDQGSFAESELLPIMGMPDSAIRRIPPHGTVSGSALLLAASISSGPIIAIGLDLAAKGDAGHARPHGFDFLSESPSRRLQGEEALHWSRSLGSCPDPIAGHSPWASSRSLSAYASGLDASLSPLRQRLYRLNPSPIRLGSFAEISAADISGLIASPVLRSPRAAERAPRLAHLASAEKRERLLRAVLSKWLSDASEAARALASGALLDDSPVAELLRCIDIVDYAAARRAVLSGGDPEPASAELSRRAGAFIGDLRERLFP